VLTVLVACTIFFGYWAKDFRLDASGDSLVLENDSDLRYYRGLVSRYGSPEFVVITFTPKGDLFGEESLNALKRLREDLRALDRVSSVVSILDVPLLKNPPGSLKDLKDNIKSLDSPEADVSLAVKEFGESPLYQKLIVSEDLRSTAVQVNFETDKEFEELQGRRSALRDSAREADLSPEEAAELQLVERSYRTRKDLLRSRRHEDVARIRLLIGRYRSEASLFLGGVPMIVDDMISFIKNDLRVFGVGMLLFLILTLGVLFRRPRWVFLPMLCCAASAVLMVGLLGLCRWDVTVVSSNFISLQLIFTMSFAIHIVVRYRELLRKDPEKGNEELVLDAVRDTFIPCLYSALTTMAGFCSLVICDILPVVNFGWMMTMGLGVSLAVTFLLLPAGLILLPKLPPAAETDIGLPVTSFFARFAERRRNLIFGVSLIVAVATGVGLSRLEVENSFIDYFKETTEIYRGMEFIDRNLGGTTPLDVLIDLGKPKAAEAAPASAADDDTFDEFGEFEEEEEPSRYWFNTARLETIGKVHDYMAGLDATGKVLSLSTLWKLAADLNGGEPLDDFSGAILFNSMTGPNKAALVDPYVSVDEGQARVTTRIKDSMKSLRRDALLKRVRRELVEEVGLEEGQFRLSGLMVLYNNMLQSLFRSQIKTIGFTALALTFMFFILFRSVKVAVIGMAPNLLASMTVLGVMGLGGIPLDVMTITIVAISVGIAVDNTIHYLVRFRRELPIEGTYLKAMYRCHRSIGNAMFYTSLTITVGFSILALSNFIPSILFGLLTALAMVMALLGALALLPRLILLTEPFGPEGGSAS